MSKQNTLGTRRCLQCAEAIYTGSYCDEVSIRMSSGKEEVRLLHGGPCCMAFIKRTGVDIIRMAHPVVPVALLG